MEKICRICGSKFETIENGGSRQFCFDCVPSTENRAERTISKRQAMKKEGVKLLGGECQHCGENQYFLLDFHHLTPEDKKYTPSTLIANSEIELFFEEIKKCVLLCSNCHRELHWRLSNEKDFKASEFIESKVAIENDINREYSKIKRVCTECGKPITAYSKSGLCFNCSRKEHRIVKDRPSAEELIQDIKSTSMLATGRKYGVSDNAIRKWLKAYGLPTSTKEIKKL